MERELRLLEPSVRSNRAEVMSLLHDDFIEFGASGRVLDAAGIATTLEQEAGDEAVNATDLRPLHLATDVILLTYRIDHHDHASLRSSIWLRSDGSWRIRFHQGTTMAKSAS
ncbi:MAG: DUF4440 domain-containing protein [Actinomycetota bacterium]|nr:DUF4440 domain-containing protein [Actinomycetota bacterium]